MTQPFSDVAFTTYPASVTEALDAIGAQAPIAAADRILIKPNLVEASPPPITTPTDCVEAVIAYVRRHSRASITIGEGCGASDTETWTVFEQLGYADMAERLRVDLVDLNNASLVERHRPDLPILSTIILPEILFDHLLISVPVLKAHSLCMITGTLKNMMGCLPPAHFGNRFGSWKKASFHQQLHEKIMDLNAHRTPDITVMDARVGLAEHHLGGPTCDPPANRILAGLDPLAVDRRAAELLGMNWQAIDHLAAPAMNTAAHA